MFGRWDDRGLGNETTVFFFLIFCISHIFCNKHSFQLSWKTEAFHLDFYSNLSSSQVAKGANFKLKPLCTGSLPESESSLTSSVSSLARKLALLSSHPQPFCSAGPASPHLGAGAGITLEPLFPEPVPSSPESQQCLSSLLSWFPFWIFPAFSFQGQMADFVKHSHFSSADLQLFKTHHPPSLVTRFPQAAWWDLASVERLGREKLFKGKLANALVDFTSFIWRAQRVLNEDH